MIDQKEDTDLDTELDVDVQIVGGATEQLFPLIQRWLLDSITNRLALEHVAPVKKMRKYRSVIDYLVCRIFPEYKEHCFAYYLQKGPILYELISEEERINIEALILKALAYSIVCYEASEQKLKIKVPWGSFVSKLREEK